MRKILLTVNDNKIIAIKEMGKPKAKSNAKTLKKKHLQTLATNGVAKSILVPEAKNVLDVMDGLLPLSPENNYRILREKFLRYGDCGLKDVDECMLHRILNLLHHEQDMSNKVSSSVMSVKFRALVERLLSIYHLIKDIYDSREHTPQFCVAMINKWHRAIYNGFVNILNVDEMYHYVLYSDCGLPDRN